MSGIKIYKFVRARCLDVKFKFKVVMVARCGSCKTREFLGYKRFVEVSTYYLLSDCVG